MEALDSPKKIEAALFILLEEGAFDFLDAPVPLIREFVSLITNQKQPSPAQSLVGQMFISALEDRFTPVADQGTMGT